MTKISFIIPNNSQFSILNFAKNIIPYISFGLILLLDFILIDELVSNIVLIILSLVVMIIFAGYLLDSGEKLANKLKLSPFIIGLILIPLLSSFHEQILNILTNIKEPGIGEISLAQQIGNKIFELLITFGIVGYLRCRLGKCISVDKQDRVLTLRNGIFMIIGTIILASLSLIDGNLNFQDGIILIIFYVLFVFMVYITNKMGYKEYEQEEVDEDIKSWQEILKLTLFLSIIIVLSNITSDKVIFLNETYNLFNKFSFIIMGILIALPNLIISLIGLLKGKTSIVIGLNIGSTIWELSISVAIIILINPILSFTGFSTIILIISAIISGIISMIYIRTKWQLKGWESILLILLYIGIIYVVLFYV